MGFREVYDYAAGKLDWFAFGLPRAGTAADIPNAGEIARRDLPGCRPEESVADVLDRFAAGWSQLPVLDPSGVVVGRARQERLGDDLAARLDSLMEPGPSTYRPSVSLQEISERMRKVDVESVLITTSDGRLWGLLKLEDAEQALADARG